MNLSIALTDHNFPAFRKALQNCVNGGQWVRIGTQVGPITASIDLTLFANDNKRNCKTGTGLPSRPVYDDPEKSLGQPQHVYSSDGEACASPSG